MTGEELYKLNIDAILHVYGKSATFSVEWPLREPQLQLYWEHLVLLVTQAQQAPDDPSTGAHTPSHIPDIVPLPKDRSWEQFYPGQVKVDEQRVRELYSGGRTKEWLLRAFANLSSNELERILADNAPI